MGRACIAHMKSDERGGVDERGVGARRLGESACVVKSNRRAVMVAESAFFAVVLPCGAAQGTARDSGIR